MYDVFLIAKYIIMRCNENNQPISNLKLQKILYFVQAEMLVARNKPCFLATIEAWIFGPVVPQIYRQYRIFGNASIPYVGRDSFGEIRNEDRELLNGIIDECGQYSASTLVQITHQQSPWRDAYAKGNNSEITRESIYRFFSEDNESD